MNKNYEALENRFNRMDALGGAISMLHWDMSAMMPKGGTASRTDQLAVLKTIHHSMITDAEVPGCWMVPNRMTISMPGNRRILKKCGGNGSTPQPLMQN